MILCAVFSPIQKENLKKQTNKQKFPKMADGLKKISQRGEDSSVAGRTKPGQM